MRRPWLNTIQMTTNQDEKLDQDEDDEEDKGYEPSHSITLLNCKAMDRLHPTNKLHFLIRIPTHIPLAPPTLVFAYATYLCTIATDFEWELRWKQQQMHSEIRTLAQDWDYPFIHSQSFTTHKSRNWWTNGAICNLVVSTGFLSLAKRRCLYFFNGTEGVEISLPVSKPYYCCTALLF